MKPIKLFLEILGWLQIVFGPTLTIGIVAFIIYVYLPGKFWEIMAILILLTGFVFGVIWATRIWKKHGTIEWLSSIRRIK
jgi:hypothetical protein